MQALRGVCTRRQCAPALLHGSGANINNTLALSAAAMLLHLGDSMQPRVLVWQRTPKGAAHRERALRRRGGRVARSSRHSVAPHTENAMPTLHVWTLQRTARIDEGRLESFLGMRLRLEGSKE